MIDHLESLLRFMLMDGVPGLRPLPPPNPPPAVVAEQVGFQPPDEGWRTQVSNLQLNALNVYLVDVRENRKLRSNERRRSVEAGQVFNTPAPAQADFHYIVSAWSPAQISPAVEPTLDEHVLLYQALAVFLQAAPFNPSRIYPPGSPLLASVPELIRDSDLPTQVAPTEGFTKLPEFWSTMGGNARWKPVVYLVVTLPVVLEREIAGPMVTTKITEYRQSFKPETAEVWIQIGGHVLDATLNPPVPVPGAWVQLETLGGEPLQSTITSSLGRFTFERLQPGNYRLRWRAGARPEPTPRTIEVPSPTGEYDLQFI